MIKKERLVSTFSSSFAVNTRLSENGYKAVRFHLQILHQLNIENKFSLSQKNDTQVKRKKKEPEDRPARLCQTLFPQA